MDPNDFIEFSGHVAARGKAGARTAVSRAYYGAFHLAFSLLEEFDCAPPKLGASHDLVPQFLASSSNGDAGIASSLLGDLHSERLKSTLCSTWRQHTRYGRDCGRSDKPVVRSLSEKNSKRGLRK
jgi:hypothetical protein